MTPATSNRFSGGI